jgi:hypothetical protein
MVLPPGCRHGLSGVVVRRRECACMSNDSLFFFPRQLSVVVLVLLHLYSRLRGRI